jgi:hypothetical protein
MSAKEMVAELPKNQLSLVVVAQNIASGLQAFENRKAELITLKEEVEHLKIESLEDRAGIKQVTEARKKLKAARVEIEKEGKAMRDPLTAVNKHISGKEKELVDIIEPTEKMLSAQEKWVKDEEARIAAEEQQKENDRINSRIKRMSAYGYEIDFNMVKILSDDDFEKMVERAKVEFEKEEAAKAEKERAEHAQREQDELDRAELKALRAKQEEADKILKEREQEIDRKEAEMKRREEEDRIMAEKKAEKEMKDARFEPRAAELTAMGFVRHGPDFSLEDTWSTYWEQVYNMSDQEWPKYIKDIEDAIERRKIRLAEEEKKRVADLEEARQRGIREAKEAEEKRMAEEAERVAQASDKDKFAVIVSYLENLPAIEPKSAKHKKLLAEVKDLNAKVIAHIKGKA